MYSGPRGTFWFLTQGTKKYDLNPITDLDIYQWAYHMLPSGLEHKSTDQVTENNNQSRVEIDGGGLPDRSPGQNERTQLFL